VLLRTPGSTCANAIPAKNSTAKVITDASLAVLIKIPPCMSFRSLLPKPGPVWVELAHWMESPRGINVGALAHYTRGRNSQRMFGRFGSRLTSGGVLGYLRGSIRRVILTIARDARLAFCLAFPALPFLQSGCGWTRPLLPRPALLFPDL